MHVLSAVCDMIKENKEDHVIEEMTRKNAPNVPGVFWKMPYSYAEMGIQRKRLCCRSVVSRGIVLLVLKRKKLMLASLNMAFQRSYDGEKV